MRIGCYQLRNPVFLAPMAGITDQPFRQLCSEFGAGLTFSEMMSSNPQVWHTEKSRLRLARVTDSEINAVQIAGSDPEEMAQAAQVNVQYGADLIDINMGCPAKKVNRKLAGSALLQYPKLVEEILHAVVKAVDVPVTLKIRTGWNKDNQNCVEIAKIAEQAGISALTIHGRTRACLFNGHAEYENIKAVKSQVSMPVIANGDIQTAEQALAVLDYTQADGVMIGRAALGNPWIFQEVVAKLTHGETIKALDLEQKFAVVYRHIKDLHQFYGEAKGYRIARKHVAWYLNGLVPDTDFKHSFNAIESAAEQLDALENFFTLQILEKKRW
ncbi:tRNA dihydrouridine synthase DusB [Actinobacillus delphinicola]|uniref:tRNA-dihydrouridine synthase B n=1 Tax=Actinobacillus delphinicola TaxID=51161 RepID=A0A448TSN9_9PAST|nr:tRNA dihydrouridine synthase DusB [Actinobacillus delphinicola]VEJ08936.1 nifR3 family TIM-barrel protein [Actinobacillus delphinicola]